MTIKANRDYKKGEEIKYCRKGYLNDELLLRFGTVLKNNYFEYF